MGMQDSSEWEGLYDGLQCYGLQHLGHLDPGRVWGPDLDSLGESPGYFFLKPDLKKPDTCPENLENRWTSWNPPEISSFDARKDSSLWKSDIVHVVQFLQRKFDLEQPVQASLFASEITPQNPEHVIFPNVCWNTMMCSNLLGLDPASRRGA